jgi:hypothetical protein
MENFDTLSAAVTALEKQGYTDDLKEIINAEEKSLLGDNFEAAVFEVDKVFRFEDNTDPDDQAVVYAISSAKYQKKGLLISSFGIYADEATNQLLQHLKIHA